MSTLVAVLDADVLVPILSCDLLLSAFDEDLYHPVVTPTILEPMGQTTPPGRRPACRWRPHPIARLLRVEVGL